MKEIDWDSLRELITDGEQHFDVGQFDVISKDKPSNNFEIEMVKGVSSYAQRKRIREYLEFLSKLPQTDDILKIKAQLYVSQSKEYKQVYELMLNDLNEIKSCLSVKAYKAAIILSGSVLEAFLLDWLSDRDGRDYFEEPYMIEKKGEDGKIHREKRSDLSTYIEQIKEIEKPNWMDSSKKAHFIRRKRNNVHAKLCLKEGTEINEETCQKVLDYLVEIIELKFSSWTLDKEPDFIIRF